jgi:hypothetical protein
MKTSNSSHLIVTFIITIACKNFTRNWEAACLYLSQTVRSLLNSEDSRFAVVIVGHESPKEWLPLDERIHFLSLDRPPPARESKNIATIADDCQSKLKLGLQYAKEKLPSDYLMRMDADDFLSKKMVGFLSQNIGVPGFRISDGWIWNSGDQMLIQKTEKFDWLCGSSIILRSDIAENKFSIDQICAQIPDIVVKAEQGLRRSLITNEIHASAGKAMALHGLDIVRVPFAGGIYRVGHVNNMTQRTTKPVHTLRFLLGRVRRLRLMTPSLRKEFALY